MAEKKTPQQGEWWFSDTRPDRVFVYGVGMLGRVIVENDSGVILGWDGMSGWHHEPRCTGWDWVPPVVPDPGDGYRIIDKTKDAPDSGDEYWSSGGGWIPRVFPKDPFSPSDIYRRKVRPVNLYLFMDTFGRLYAAEKAEQGTHKRVGLTNFGQNVKEVGPDGCFRV